MIQRGRAYLLATQQPDGSWPETTRPRGGESYAQVSSRVAQWHASVAIDTVVAAHGGTARALIAHLALAPPEEAANYSIDQGVVYVFTGNKSRVTVNPAGRSCDI